MPSSKLSERLRELREARGLTQSQLAERAQVTLGYVSVIEGGQPGNPPNAILQRLAKALGVTVKKLEGKDD